MSIDVQCEVLIVRPRSEVAAYMFHPANDAEWTAAVKSCRALTEGRLKVGSQVERTVSFLGREFSYLYEVIEAQGDDFVVITVDKPFPMHVRYELEDADGGTITRIRTSGDATGFFKMAGPVMAPMVRRNLKGDLDLLRSILERV